MTNAASALASMKTPWFRVDCTLNSSSSRSAASFLSVFIIAGVLDSMNSFASSTSPLNLDTASLRSSSLALSKAGMRMS